MHTLKNVNYSFINTSIPNPNRRFKVNDAETTPAKFQINGFNSQARKNICLINKYVPLGERYYGECLGK